MFLLSSKKLKVSKAAITNVLEDHIEELKADNSGDQVISFPLKFRGFEVVTVKMTVALSKAQHRSYVTHYPFLINLLAQSPFPDLLLGKDGYKSKLSWLDPMLDVYQSHVVKPNHNKSIAQLNCCYRLLVSSSGSILWINSSCCVVLPRAAVEIPNFFISKTWVRDAR